MKKTTWMAAILATATLATSATAGSLSDPVVEPTVIIEDATSSSSGTAMVAVLALLMAVAVAE